MHPVAPDGEGQLLVIKEDEGVFTFEASDSYSNSSSYRTASECFEAGVRALAVYAGTIGKTLGRWAHYTSEKLISFEEQKKILVKLGLDHLCNHVGPISR